MGWGDVGLIFDSNLANIFWNGKGSPSTQEKKAEAYRLYKEIQGYAAYSYVDDEGNTIDVPERKGIDLLSANLQQFKSFIDDPTIPKSNAIIKMCFMVAVIRFPDKLSQIKQSYPQYADRIQNFYDNRVDSDEWVGNCGFYYDPDI